MPSRSSRSPSPHSASIARRVAAAVAAAALLLAAVCAWVYAQDLRHRRSLLFAEGEYVASLEHEFLSRELQAVRSDVLYLAQQPILRRLAGGAADAREALEREYAVFARAKPIYDQIRFLDAGGREVVRINHRRDDVEVVPRERLQTKATRYYYREAITLDAGEVFVSPFDLNVEHGEIERPINPVIRFATPVDDPAGARRGLVVLNYLGARLLTKLREISRGFPGRTLLLNRDGEYLQAPESDLEWGWLLGHGRSFRHDHPAAWSRLRGAPGGRVRIGGDLFSVRRLRPDAPAAAAMPSPDAASALLIVSHLPAAVVEGLGRPLRDRLLVLSAAVLALVGVVALTWARASVARREQEEKLAESEARLRLLSSRLLAAQEAERRSLSRTLHDELGQRVTAISLDLKSALRRPADERSAPLLRRAADETDRLLASLHAIATRIRPSVLDDLGLRDAIESHVSEYTERTGICVACELRFGGDAVPDAVAENVYRILQEALANVASHAGTSEARVEIGVESGVLEMVVEDRGRGFDPEGLKTSSRLGILGMRERVELLGGDFRLDAEPGRGTRIRVLFPLAGGPGAAGFRRAARKDPT